MPDLQPSPTLSTPRLTLRAPELGDAAVLAMLGDDYDVARMTTRMPHPYTLRDAEEFVGRLRARTSADQQTFLIDADGEGCAGVIGFFIDDGAVLPEIGYWLGRPFWGRGYATEAAEAALAWAGAEWGRRAIRSGHFADNDASGRVLCKAGFLYTGVVERRYSRARGADMPTRMMVWLA
jgi:RimJ/RimL family protein N-acetyltransferase